MKFAKTTFATSLSALALIALIHPASAQDSSDFADALFRAAPTPQGYFQLGVSEEYFTSNFFYSEFDDFGDEFPFATDDFKTWTTKVDLAFGLTDSLELGVSVPLVNASWKAGPDDLLSSNRSRSDFGVGDIELSLGYGFQSADESLFGLITVGAGLPTSSLDDFFGGSTASGFADVEIEKYIGNFGVVLGAGADYSDYENFGGFGLEDEWTWEYRAGFAWLFSDKLYAQVLYVGEPDSDTGRIEGYLEYLVNDRSSVEIFGARDVSGDEEGTLGGVGVNVFFGQ